MAKKRSLPNTSSVETRSFNKGMVKDVNEGLMGEGAYLNARNAANNSRTGDLGVIGNEQSNKFCTGAPYTIIGAIHMYADMWAIFSTDNTNSEIGSFDESTCTYSRVTNDPCLNFKKTNPILGGEAKENFDCTWEVYFADALNPDRKINMDNPPFIEDCEVIDDCRICTPTTELDCDMMRMARLTDMPCITIEQGPNGGEMLNGTYQAVIAYTENEQRVSDYSIPSNILSIFDHRNVNGSIDIIIEDIDQSYDEFELVIMGFVNQKLAARRLGVYSTHQSRISIDRIDEAVNEIIPIQFIPLDRPSYEKSEGIYRNGEYLIRVAPTEKFSFNYQPLANQITTEWVSVEYDMEYYRKAGVNVGYMRDEVYPFFIRWIYNTLDKSDSYHIPGRAPAPGETDPVASPAYGTGLYFEEFNTAGAVPFAPSTTPDGGVIAGKGYMGYWQSTEIYPDNKPEIWGDLCGKNIRHHKMPDNKVDNHFTPAPGAKIRVLGVQFKDIPYPLDNDGNPIPAIVGYEILRGTREGNKTVVAKGMLNNMGSYIREDNGEPAYYQNYPYNDLNYDPYLSTEFGYGDNNNSAISNNSNVQALGGLPNEGGLYQDNKFTFHGPDTQFKHPFLSAKELKVYETVYGTPEGVFNEPYKHPQFKMITNFSFLLGALIGFGIAMKAVKGEEKTTRSKGNYNNFNHARDWAVVMPTPGGGTIGAGLGYGIDNAVQIATLIAMNTADGVTQGLETSQNLTGAEDYISIILGQVGDSPALPSKVAALAANITNSSLPGVDSITTFEYDTNGNSGIPGTLRVLQGIPTFLAFWGEGTNTYLELIKSFSKFRPHVAAYESHCFFNHVDYTRSGERVGINDASYIGSGLQEFGGITVNNLYRGGCVGVITTASPNVLSNPPVEDKSRFTMFEQFNNTKEKNLNHKFNGPDASAHYVGFKQRLRNQYGQVDGIIQVPTASCMQRYIVDPERPEGATSEIIFGGDTYIGRYTEKNTMFFFSDWMYDLPNGFEYDYRLKKMMPFPQYWMDTKDFQINEFFQGIYDSFTPGGSTGGTAATPSGFHNFDRTTLLGGGSFLPNLDFTMSLMVKNAFMYLFNSGVRDFFVESEVNVEYRDWDDDIKTRHYDPYLYTDYEQLFRTDRIKDSNFYKYDYSLSASRYYQGYPSWAIMQYRNYDPQIAETCYTYYPNRVIYSLPQQTELRYDNWLLYLVDNYKDFTSRVTTIKPVAKNGAMLLFENEAPIQFLGVDQLETTAGTKITLGDGGLFSQALQNIVNADESYEYGSCQDRLSVVNTPAGLFWISQNQGKIFNYGQGLTDISQKGMKWWFDEYLPYKIVEDFPDFELQDNTVIGVGCQAIYDNSDAIVYFTKRDFKLLPQWAGRVTYIGEDNFQLGAARFKLGDERYFEDASWTVSYDPKAAAWISFHDWHPNFLLPSKNNFMSVKNANIWKHNDRSDSYCNYYGDDYPFEVELVSPTGQTVNTLKSVEYLMEVYRWDAEERDKHHVLDFNFDRAFVYNTEQISGELRLNLSPQNNAPELNSYPRVNPSSIDILYSKVEQKYRFNQFWDITDDRGEFGPARRTIWNTNYNGYTKQLNPLNVDYNKPPHQRKKFRHYQSNLWLIRRISGPHSMQLKLVNSKNQYSPR